MAYRFDMAMLDPWYNKRFGGRWDDHLAFVLGVIRRAYPHPLMAI